MLRRHIRAEAVGMTDHRMDQLLIRSGREEQAMMTTLAGIVIVLFLVVQMISEFFDTVRTLFQF